MQKHTSSGRWRSGTHGRTIKILFALTPDCFVTQRHSRKQKDVVKLTCESIWNLLVRCFFSARPLITLTWWFGLSSLQGEVYELSDMKWQFTNQITEQKNSNKIKNCNQAVQPSKTALDTFGKILKYLHDRWFCLKMQNTFIRLFWLGNISEENSNFQQ